VKQLSYCCKELLRQSLCLEYQQQTQRKQGCHALPAACRVQCTVHHVTPAENTHNMLTACAKANNLVDSRLYTIFRNYQAICITLI